MCFLEKSLKYINVKNSNFDNFESALLGNQEVYQSDMKTPQENTMAI